MQRGCIKNCLILLSYKIKITIYLEEGKVVARLEVVLILLLADVATTEDALWAVVVFVVAVVAVKKVNKIFFCMKLIIM